MFSQLSSVCWLLRYSRKRFFCPYFRVFVTVFFVFLFFRLILTAILWQLNEPKLVTGFIIRKINNKSRVRSAYTRAWLSASVSRCAVILNPNSCTWAHDTYCVTLVWGKKKKMKENYCKILHGAPQKKKKKCNNNFTPYESYAGEHLSLPATPFWKARRATVLSSPKLTLADRLTPWLVFSSDRFR